MTRAVGIQIFYVPHHRSERGDFKKWSTPRTSNCAVQAQVFAKDSWGGEWHLDFQPTPDNVMIKEHWARSGFANTDHD